MPSRLRQPGLRIRRTRPPPIFPISPFFKLRSWAVNGTKCLSPESESARSVVVAQMSNVGFVPPLHGSGFPYTPPSTPKLGIRISWPHQSRPQSRLHRMPDIDVSSTARRQYVPQFACHLRDGDGGRSQTFQGIFQVCGRNICRPHHWMGTLLPARQSGFTRTARK
ncbi:hypothetical protein H4582DRAFT_761342 [Lactarius indigo]|nr:hypothetical protein H4582DRAFT_761342 [Lactarius indigo]